jgi:hypothetical protein
MRRTIGGEKNEAECGARAGFIRTSRPLAAQRRERTVQTNVSSLARCSVPAKNFASASRRKTTLPELLATTLLSIMSKQSSISYALILTLPSLSRTFSLSLSFSLSLCERPKSTLTVLSLIHVLRPPCLIVSGRFSAAAAASPSRKVPCRDASDYLRECAPIPSCTFPSSTINHSSVSPRPR